ncbi:MAG: acyl-CoA synthetase, partial [Solirubrobacterales bacterium]|nr:acyl-CoA synthetase [Solirubrobacterales bacterium]
AWLATGDLFRRDADGDYWRVDGIADVIHTAGGAVFSTPIRDALGNLPAVDLAVAYPVVPLRDRHPLAVAAVTLRSGAELSTRDISAALGRVPEPERPAVVHVVDTIPLTTWFRPNTAPLREAGLPEPAPGKQAWFLDRAGAYRPLTDAAWRRLARAEA